MTYPRINVVADMLPGIDDLEAVRAMIVREQAIRDTMAKTGEDRQTVTDMMDALQSMDQEAVLDLAEGEPTTLRDALLRYIDSLDRYPNGVHTDSVAAELHAILTYPWSGEEERVQLHQPNESLALHIVEGDDRDLEIRMGSNRWLVARVSWEDAGSGGVRAAEDAVRTVYRAVLARVIADRDHIVQLNARQTADLRTYLDRPNGSWTGDKRLSVDAVAGGGVLVRTRPYSWAAASALADVRRRVEESDR